MGRTFNHCSNCRVAGPRAKPPTCWVVAPPEHDEILHAGQIRLAVCGKEQDRGIAGKLPGDGAAAFGRIAEGSLHEGLLVKLEIGPRAGVEHFAAQPVPKFQLPCGAVLAGPPDEGRILQEIDLGPRRAKFVQTLAHGAIQQRLGSVDLHAGGQRLERAGVAPAPRAKSPRGARRAMRSVQAWGDSPWSAFMATPAAAALAQQIRGDGRGQPAELADLQASQADVAGRIVGILAIAGFAGRKARSFAKTRDGRARRARGPSGRRRR